MPLTVVQMAACKNEMTVQQDRAQLDERQRAAFEYNDDSSKGKLQEAIV